MKLPWREAGPPHHVDDEVDSDQRVANKELSLWWQRAAEAALGRSCGDAHSNRDAHSNSETRIVIHSNRIGGSYFKVIESEAPIS